jgi:hypothetical protein
MWRWNQNVGWPLIVLVLSVISLIASVYWRLYLNGYVRNPCDQVAPKGFVPAGSVLALKPGADEEMQKTVSGAAAPAAPQQPAGLPPARRQVIKPNANT